MELMNNASSINNATPKLIEFSEHFILNTQLYDKRTLKPVPMKFYTNDNTPNVFALLQTSIIKTSYYQNGGYCAQYNNEHNNQMLVQDKNNSNIFYVIQQYGTYSESDNQYLYKIQYEENAKKYNIIKTFFSNDVRTNGYHDKSNIKILYDFDNYFMLSITTQHQNTYQPNTSTYGYICLLDKNSFEYFSLFNSYYNFVLKVDNDIAYLLGVSINDYYTRLILKLNTSSKTCSAIWTETSTSTRIMNCNPIQIEDYFYVLTSYLENGVYTYKFMKISLNTTTDTVNTEMLNINLNGFIMDSTTNSDMSYGGLVNYTLRVIKTSSNIYISCLIHTVPNHSDATHYYQHKHVLLKFNGTSFTVVDVIPLIDGCYGALEYNDSKHQIWYMSNCALFYVFDEAKEKMICTYKKPGVFMQIGLDSLNRFITQTSDNTIEMLTDVNACVLKADFSEEIYDKSSTAEIDTIVSFYAKNFLDEYIETNVNLTLIGPVVFKENGLNKLNISTLDSGIREVPVTITGYGSIEVIITQST